MAMLITACQWMAHRLVGPHSPPPTPPPPPSKKVGSLLNHMYVLNDNADHCLPMDGTQTWVLCSDFAFRFYFPILFRKKKTNTKKSQEDKSASSNFEKKQDNL